MQTVTYKSYGSFPCEGKDLITEDGYPFVTLYSYSSDYIPTFINPLRLETHGVICYAELANDEWIDVFIPLSEISERITVQLLTLILGKKVRLIAAKGE